LLDTVRHAQRLLGSSALGYALLLWLGRTYGTTAAERATALPGDEIVLAPQVVTDHAITVDAPPDAVWPWLVQMGWHRAGWYTARWVDRLLFPDNLPSADRIVPELQHTAVGDFIPDGPPKSGCGFIVERLEPDKTLVLHSTSHLPAKWRRHRKASLDWSWAFVLRPVDNGRRTRFLSRSRWTTAPWWLTVGGRLAVVPVDFVMSRSLLRGVKQRAERLTRAASSTADARNASTERLRSTG
jgi:hypothetical protein